MRNIPLFLGTFFIFCFAFISCQKIEMRPQSDANNSLLQKNVSSFASGGFHLVSAPYIPHDDDSIERPTTLGIKLTNPYSIANMRQAYADLDLSSSLATVTNLYVRFLPSSVNQLVALDSIMDSQGLELFDTPVDYDVTYEGDYYQDPSIPDEQITWQYAVVPPNFQFPAGIQYETLASIHIPGDDYTAVETEAERLAYIQDSLSYQMMAINQTSVQPNVLECGIGYHWDYTQKRCMPNGCSDDEYWDGTKCVPYPPDPPPLPPPAPDAAIPAGNIFVHDTNLNTDVPVRKARVVARRWFKIERTYTGDNGHFVFTKRFKHKVRINVKFKNDYASVRGMRGIRLWQMLSAVKKTIGIFSGDKSNIQDVTRISQTFGYAPGVGNIDITTSNKSTRFWAAATTLNSVQEYRDYATPEAIGLPPTGLKIILTSWGHGSGATPMFAKRAVVNLSAEWVGFHLSPPAAIIAAVIAVLKGQIDIVGSYNFRGGFSSITSDKMKELFYHELTHAAHYAALGNTWYTSFVNAEITEIISNVSSGYSPYGDGTNSSSPIVALGESWAYYIGHIFSDKKYGTSAGCWSEQDGLPGTTYCNYNGTGHPHLDVEENFNPNLAADHFEWIPQGLFYDLMDSSTERKANGYPVDDYVAGYTNAQMFNAFQSSIYTLQDYRVKLLQQTSNPTSGNVPGLFAQYNY